MRPHLAQNAQRAVHGFHDFADRRMAAGILQLAQQQRVYPFAVRAAADPGPNLRADVLGEGELIVLELSEIAVVGESERRLVVVERMQILPADVHPILVRDAAHVRQRAARTQLPGQIAQIAVEGGQIGRGVAVRDIRHAATRVPSHHAEACEIEHVEHLRLVRLLEQRAVGLVKQIL